MSEGAHGTARRGSLLVISAPSGTGKSSLVKRLLALDPRVVFSVSATTRAPRAGEREGQDYHFLSRADFERRIAAGEFLEHAEVHGNCYGTLRASVDDVRASGRSVLLDIDVQGARQVAAADPSSQLVFIAPPSRAELERRIRGRGLDAPDVIQRRLENAVGEMAELHHFDSVIVNRELDRAVAELARIAAGEDGARVGARVGAEATRGEVDAILASFGLPPLPADPRRWTT